MDDIGTVNSRIVDCVSDVNTLVTGLGPSEAFSMLDAVMVETMGMAMYNAVNRQQGSSMVGSAAVTAACARMLTAFAPVHVQIIEPEPPPLVEPLKGPTPIVPTMVVVTPSEASTSAGAAASTASSATATSVGADIAEPGTVPAGSGVLGVIIAHDSPPPPPATTTMVTSTTTIVAPAAPGGAEP